MDFLIVGNGLFGAATARHLAPHATVTVVGPGVRTGDAVPYGAHHDEGRIIGDLGRDVVWSELNRRARDGMTDLDPALITPCGGLTATTRDRTGHRGSATQVRQPTAAALPAMTAQEARTYFPMTRFRPDEVIVHQPAAGHFSPRRYITLANSAAARHGATITAGTVTSLRTCAAGIRADLRDGQTITADAAIVTTGAFAAGSGLLPVPVALRAKSEVYVMAELDDQQAAGLNAMPCINRTTTRPGLADLYVLPPIRYPDGRTYIKFGANTMTDHWLADPAAVRAWYDHGNDRGQLPAMRQALASLLPGITIRGWHARRCADAYTAHWHPYIDTLEPGRLTIALGGNGRGAQAADAIGHLTARLALTGQWQSDLPHEAFRHVPARGPWNGMTLLRDHARQHNAVGNDSR